MDQTVQAVEERYSKAAVKQEAELCCPTGYADDELAHIPKEVKDVSYGCGNPTAFRSLKEGSVIVDLGSGAGIDCFIAAKKVGPKGKVYGVDMTDTMLAKARKNQELVADSLGYNNVEFVKGTIDELPIDTGVADTIISNCVINLATDKGKVFKEIYRVLKDKGTFSVSDIVADREVPQHLKDDEELWSGCLSGAETTENYLKAMSDAGFFGLEVLKSFVWQEIEGIKFISVTVRGYKLARSPECLFKGQMATYIGPMKQATDDEEHVFLRGIPQEVCTETAKRLSLAPYKGQFLISNPDDDREVLECCSPSEQVESSGACC